MRVGSIRKHGSPGEVTFIESRRIVSMQQKLVFTVNIHDFLRVVGNLNVEWRNRKLAIFVSNKTLDSLASQIQRKGPGNSEGYQLAT